MCTVLQMLRILELRKWVFHFLQCRVLSSGNVADMIRKKKLLLMTFFLERILHARSDRFSLNCQRRIFGLFGPTLHWWHDNFWPSCQLPSLNADSWWGCHASFSVVNNTLVMSVLLLFLGEQLPVSVVVFICPLLAAMLTLGDTNTLTTLIEWEMSLL